jgi:hypothetical protein
MCRHSRKASLELVVNSLTEICSAPNAPCMVAGRGHLRRKSRDFEEIDEDRDVSLFISTEEYAVSRVKTI